MTYVALLEQLRQSYQDVRTRELPVLNVVQTRQWLEALSAFPLAEVKAVVDAAPMRWKWFPMLSDVLGQLTGDLEQYATEALLAAERAARSIGSYTAVTFEDGALAEALRVSWGTWPRFCLSDRESPSYLSNRKLFLSSYAKYRQQGYSSQPATMSGIHGMDKAETVKALRPAPALTLKQKRDIPPSRQEAAAILKAVTERVKSRENLKLVETSAPHQTQEHS